MAAENKVTGTVDLVTLCDFSFSGKCRKERFSGTEVLRFSARKKNETKKTGLHYVKNKKKQ